MPDGNSNAPGDGPGRGQHDSIVAAARRALGEPQAGWRGLRRWLAPIALTLGLGHFLFVANEHLPLKDWLVWTYIAIYGLTAAFALACLSSGNAALLWLLRRPLPVAEHLTLSFALGVLLFFLAMFGGGLLGAYGAIFFVACPALLTLAGARPLVRYGRRLWHHIAYMRARRPRPRTALHRLIVAGGAVAIVAMYLPVLTPSHVGFDSGWYHVPIAEHYAAERAIRPFAEGWYLGAYPHLSSLLYTWAMLWPKANYFARVELAAHLEFLLFLATIAGVPALVHRVLPATRGRTAWAACFLFPTIFFHDTQLAGDHVAALWSVPIFLAVFRAYGSPSWRHGVLLGAMMAGAFLTKYTAAPMLVPPAAALVLGLVARGWRDGRAGALLAARGALSAAAAGLVLTAPHWLKNWVFYGAPFYPMFTRPFSPHPWSAEAASTTTLYFELGTFHPERSLAGLRETLGALFTFSYKAHEFYEFHRDVPYFGSLFTIATFVVPFIRPSKKLLGLVAGSYVTLFFWYWLSHVDRYLQAYIPAMAALTVAVLTATYRQGTLGRAAAVGAVGLQLVWGADVFGFEHSLTKYRKSIAVLGAIFRGDPAFKSEAYRSMADLGAALPRSSKVLLHNLHVHFGLQRKSVSDAIGLQAGLDYGPMASPRVLWQTLAQMKVTHVAWGGHNAGEDSLASDLRFSEFVGRYVSDKRPVGSLWLGSLPAAPPPDRRGDLVAYFACAHGYAPGLYRIEAMTKIGLGKTEEKHTDQPDQPLTPGGAPALLEQARFAVTQSGCNPSAANRVSASFEHVSNRGALALWVRKGE
jgi:hypothetical protein